MSKKIYLFSLVLLALAFVSCSETEEEGKFANWQTFPLLRFRYKKQKPKPVILRRINRFFYSFVNGLL